MIKEEGQNHPLLLRVLASYESGKFRRVVGGVSLPVQSAWFLIQNPSLWRYAVVPALINLMLFIVAVIVLVMHVDDILGYFWARPEISLWYHWLLAGLWYVGYGVLIAASVVLSYFFMLLVAGVVASPFNDLLSQKTEIVLTGELIDRNADEPLVRGLIRSIGLSLSTLGLYLGCMAPLLLLHLIPGVGSVAYTVMAVGVSAFFLALEYTDAAMDRFGFSLRQKLGRIRGELSLTGAFGVGMCLILVIPLANLVAMPIAVVGGTALGVVVREEKVGPSG